MGRGTALFLLDDEGNKITCKKAAKMITEVETNAGQIRYHIQRNGISTISELIALKKRFEKEGQLCQYERPTYKTKFGELTVSEIHDMHPHKKKVNKQAISSRLKRNGGMSEKLWDPPRRCGRHKQLEKTNATKKVNKKKAKPKLIIAPKVYRGDIITSQGKTFKVVNVFSNGRAPADLTCHRILGEQVLKRTTHYIKEAQHGWTKAD